MKDAYVLVAQAAALLATTFAPSLGPSLGPGLSLGLQLLAMLLFVLFTYKIAGLGSRLRDLEARLREAAATVEETSKPTVGFRVRSGQLRRSIPVEMTEGVARATVSFPGIEEVKPVVEQGNPRDALKADIKAKLKAQQAQRPGWGEG